MMCTTCGCGGGEVKIEGHDHHDHPNDHHEDNGQHRHGDESQPGHVHAPGMDGRRMVRIEQDILAKNQRHADTNRRYLAERGVFALNLVSSPGLGKTTLLVRTAEALQHRLPVAVIEGDQQTDRDAERIRATGVAALQINTGKGCHLDAHMVGHALERLQPAAGGVLFIENVGNLVCPAAFDLGEAHKVVVLSVTEGEDKPLKYPDMFHAADLMLLNKIDLLPYLAFDVDVCIGYARRINPRLVVLQVSATCGDGMAAWLEWIEGGAEQARSARERALRERKTALEQELAALQSRLGEVH